MHSLAVAVLSDLVVLEAPVPYPEGAFTAGLLHDVGKLLIAVAMPAQFERMCDMYRTVAGSLQERELEATGVTHLGEYQLQPDQLPVCFRRGA